MHHSTKKKRVERVSQPWTWSEKEVTSLEWPKVGLFSLGYHNYPRYRDNKPRIPMNQSVVHGSCHSGPQWLERFWGLPLSETTTATEGGFFGGFLLTSWGTGSWSTTIYKVFFDHPNGGWEWDFEKPSTVWHLPSPKQQKHLDIDGGKLIVSFWDICDLLVYQTDIKSIIIRSIEASRNRRESGGPVFLLSVNFPPKG